MPRARSDRLKRRVWGLHERGWSAMMIALHCRISRRRVGQILAEIRALYAARDAARRDPDG